jgi:hypothetical protein
VSPDVRDVPPDDAVYQLIVPDGEIALTVTNPGPQRLPGEVVVMDGIDPPELMTILPELADMHPELLVTVKV